MMTQQKIVRVVRFSEITMREIGLITDAVIDGDKGTITIFAMQLELELAAAA